MTNPCNSSTTLRRLVLGITMSLGVAGAVVAATPDFAVLSSNRIGGAGGWDYLATDSAGARVYISRGDHVDIYDTAAAKVVGTIANTNGVHGVALDEKRNLGYTSNGKANSITVFEISTMKVIKEVPIKGMNPDAIMYEPVNDRLYTFNGKSQDVTVLNAANLELIASLSVPGKPEFAHSDETGRVFVNIESEPGQMVVIAGGKTPSVQNVWKLNGCNAPTGLALDVAHSRAFSVCDDKVMVVTDTKTGKQVAKVTIGEGPDAAEFDAALGLVFASNGDGTLSIVHQDTPNRYTVVKSLATQRGARTMALDAKNHRIYLVTADKGPAPAPTADVPHPRPTMIPDTFTVHVVGVR